MRFGNGNTDTKSLSQKKSNPIVLHFTFFGSQYMKRRASILLLSFLTAVFFSLSFASILHAGGDESDSQIRGKLIGLLNSSQNGGAAGSEFYFSVPPCYEVPGNNSIRLYVASPVRTRVTVEVEGQAFSTTKFTIANDVIEFVLAPGIAQAYSKPDNAGAPDDRIVYQQAGVRVRAAAPIVVYVAVRFQFTSDTFLAMPVNVLGKEYQVASMADMSWMYGGLSLPSETTITAPYDNTTVTFTLGGGITPAITGGGLRSGQTRTYQLNRGDVVVIANSGDNKEGDMSGSIIKATKPVSVISGNQCANVPTSNRWCDYIADAEYPTNVWGRTVHVIRDPRRAQSGMVKIFAKEPNTIVFRNGTFFKTITTAGGMEGKGFIYDRSDASGNKVATYSANKPISVTFFEQGQEEDDIPADPFQMTMSPIEQYQKEVIFCTPGIKGGVGFSENYLTVVYAMTSGNSIPKDLEFGTVSGGKFVWTPLSDVFGSNIGDILPGTVNGKRYAAKNCKLPGDNVYRLRSKNDAFACYSYGFGNYDSYGHNTSAAFAVLTGDSIAPDPKWSVQCDGSVTDGYVKDLPNDVAIRSNLSVVYLEPEGSFNYTLEVDRFVSGDDFETRWRLTVDDPDKEARALITFRDRALNDTTIEIVYTPRKLTITPDLVFSGLRLGETASKEMTIKNEGKQRVVVSRLEFKNGGAGVFKVDPSSITLPFPLEVDESKTFNVIYTASNSETVRDSIGVGDTCVFKYRRLVQGGAGEPIIDVSNPLSNPVSFGEVLVGDAPNKDITVYSRGSMKLTINDITDPTDPAFTLEQSAKDVSATSPLVLDEVGGATTLKTYKVTFRPTAVKDYTATLTFMNNANKIDSIIHLVGKGVEPGLLVNNLDFGKKRVGKSYTLLSDWATTAVISVRNTGTAPVTVRNVRVDNAKSINPEYFNIPNLAQMSNKDIPVGSTLADVIGSPITVTYSPEVAKLGDAKLVLIIENSAGENKECEIKGFGKIPKLSITPTLAFGQVGVGTNKQMQFDIKNLSVTDGWAYEDTLNLTNFVVDIDPLEISEDITSYGIKGFNYDKASVKLPRILTPGGIVDQINANFMKTDNGTFIAKLITKSDAIQEDTSTWTASVTNLPPSIRISSIPKSVCVGIPAEIEVTITNVGPIPITNLNTVPIITGADANQFAGAILGLNLRDPIPPNGTAVIRVPFTPTGTSTANASIRVFANDGSAEATTTISGTGLQYNGFFEMGNKIDMDVNSSNPQFTLSISNRTQFNNRSYDITQAGVNQLEFVVTYNKSVLQAVPATAGSNTATVAIVPGSALDGWTVNSAVIGNSATETNTITIKVSGSKPFTNVDGSVLTVLFNPALPNGSVISDKYQVDLAVNNSNRCAVITTDPGEVVFTPFCAYGIRAVSISATTFALQQINPNPVGANGTDVNFSLGYTSLTTIELVNSNGEVVQTLANEEMKAGTYALRLIPNNLPNGSYFVRMTAGNDRIAQSQKLIISK